MVLDRYSVQS